MTELDELREHVRALELAEAIEERLLKDVDRLERMPPGSPEIRRLDCPRPRPERVIWGAVTCAVAALGAG